MAKPPISFSQIKCPVCGEKGTIKLPDRDSEYYEYHPAECMNCGRQIPMQRIPPAEVFNDDPEFDFT